MIWISTLCLLAVAAWLLFNALNERRWVETHSHDETVASDPGLFPSLSALTGSGTLDSDGNPLIDQGKTAFARTVTSVKEKTSKYGDKFTEAKAAAGKAVDGDVPASSVSTDDSSLGRVVSKVGAMTGRLDNKIGKTIKAASERTSKFAATDDPNESLLSRVSRKATAGGDVVVARAKTASQSVLEKTAASRENGVLGKVVGTVTEKTAASRESGILGKVVGTVSTGVSKLEAQIDSRAAAASDGSASKEFFSRVSSVMGKKVNDVDDKVPTKVADKMSEIDDKMTSSVGSKASELDDNISATMDKKVSKVDEKPAKENID